MFNADPILEISFFWGGGGSHNNNQITIRWFDNLEKPYNALLLPSRARSLKKVERLALAVLYPPVLYSSEMIACVRLSQTLTHISSSQHPGRGRLMQSSSVLSLSGHLCCLCVFEQSAGNLTVVWHCSGLLLETPPPPPTSISWPSLRAKQNIRSWIWVNHTSTRARPLTRHDTAC